MVLLVQAVIWDKMDRFIESLILACPESVRHRKGPITKEEREAFGRLQGHQLQNHLLNATPGYASQAKWINPNDGTIMYEDDRLRTVTLQGLGFALADIGGETTWLLRNQDVVRAFREAKVYGYLD